MDGGKEDGKEVNEEEEGGNEDVGKEDEEEDPNEDDEEEDEDGGNEDDNDAIPVIASLENGSGKESRRVVAGQPGRGGRSTGSVDETVALDVPLDPRELARCRLDTLSVIPSKHIDPSAARRVKLPS